MPGLSGVQKHKAVRNRDNRHLPGVRRQGDSEKEQKGYTFFGCENYPECNFMTWDKPTDEKCPKCGKSLFKKKGGILACLDENCGFEKKAERKKKSTKTQEED